METEYFGWAGQILKIDLSNKRIEKEPLDPALARKFIGGRGLNSYTLYKMVPEDIDAFDPRNVVIIGIGPLCGTLLPSASKVTITSKSPSTNIFGDANMGGYFGSAVKYAGYDQIIITGAADKPSYILIEDDDVRIMDGREIWGKNTWEAQKWLRDKHGSAFEVACIGQCGENRIRFANVMHGLKRAAGKFGMGAVLGSKNIKAIAVRGNGGLNIAHPEEFMDYCKVVQEKIMGDSFYKTRSVYGTPHLQDTLSPLGVMSTRNFQDSTFEDYAMIGGIRLSREYASGMRSCQACPAHCAHYYHLTDGKYAGSYGEGPEFTVTSMVGDRCGINDMDALLRANQLLNEYGMDCAAFGGLVAWLMDCYERGLIDKNDTDGLDLHFGNGDAMVELCHKVAFREGIGDILAEGEGRAPKLLGRGSEKLMQHIKGGIIIAEEPRALPGFGLQYLTSTRGSDHLRARYSLETTGIGPMIAETLFGRPDAANPNTTVDKAKGVRHFEHLMTMVDCLGVCKFNFTGFINALDTPPILAKAVSLVTGLDISEQELFIVAERVFNVEKAFNVRLGLSRKDDNFSNPEKFMEEPIRSGPHKGKVFHRDILLDEYYEVRGWDHDGMPRRSTLEQLDLKEVADELTALGKIGAEPA